MKKLLRKSQISKHGFTLAEVLITLVIIGVVAALTISPLVNTYVESSTVSKVKKGLSILGQAKKLAENQNGPIEGWDFGQTINSDNNSKFWGYLKPYFSIAKDCGANTDCYQSDGVYELSKNVVYGNYNSNSYYKFILSDGSVMWFRIGDAQWSGRRCAAENDECAVFSFDVNGTKPPNTFGKDVFIYIMRVKGVYPMYGHCNKTNGGWGCSEYIIKYNNMNYLH